MKTPHFMDEPFGRSFYEHANRGFRGWVRNAVETGRKLTRNLPGTAMSKMRKRKFYHIS